MNTQYKCACGAQINIESQGDLPVGITAAERTTINVGGKEYPLKNAAGQSLQRVDNGEAFYWTPPVPPKIAEADAANT